MGREIPDVRCCERPSPSPRAKLATKRSPGKRTRHRRDRNSAPHSRRECTDCGARTQSQEHRGRREDGGGTEITPLSSARAGLRTYRPSEGTASSLKWLESTPS